MSAIGFSTGDLGVAMSPGRIAMRGVSTGRIAAVGLVAWIGLCAGVERAQAQSFASGTYAPTYRVSDYLGAPGLYGMSYGFASYGMPQTYSVFSAYPGPSYGSNYPPYGILPGRYGVGLWRPGFVAPGYVYGASYYYPADSLAYRTFPYPYDYRGGVIGYRIASPPPVGVYAPSLGPATLYGW
jgi:hypothetical protein